MSVTVLNTVDHRGDWHQYLQLIPPHFRDIYFQPEYLDLHRLDETSQALLFVYAREKSVWLYPFLLRPINFSSEATGCYDIESQYGYGGPLSNACDPDFIREANHVFADWCVRSQIVAEFVRFHPLIDNRYLLPTVESIRDRETVSLDLERVKLGELPFGAKTNNMLRRAERSGLKCEVSANSGDFELFVRLYKETMSRLDAGSFYYFNDDYFKGLNALMQQQGFMVVAKSEEEIVAAAVFFRGANYLHYHLSATDASNRIPGVMNAVIYTAAIHEKGSLLTKLHLGGGRTSSTDDSLLKFKKTMGTDSHTFFFGKRIHNNVMYDTLRENWCRKYPHLIDKYGSQLLCYHNIN